MTLNALASQVHLWAVGKGFWDGDFDSRNFGEMVALSHSELSEALEAHRNGEPAVWYRHDKSCVHVVLNRLYDLIPDRDDCTCVPKVEGWAAEYIDTVIRIVDTLGAAHIDADDVFQRKMAYNEGRPYRHGKAY